MPSGIFAAGLPAESEDIMGKYEIRRTSNRHFELVYVFEDGTELLKSKLFPSSENKKQYTGLCFGSYERFRTIADWKQWCNREYTNGGASK